MIETVGNAVGGRTDTPVNLVVAPLTHAAGPVALATLQIGATQVILPGFDAGAVFEAIEAHGITHMYLPPTALYGLLNHPERDRFDVSSLQDLRAGRLGRVAGQVAPGGRGVRALHVPGLWPGRIADDHLLAAARDGGQGGGRRAAGAARELRQAVLFGPGLRDGR